MQIFRESIEAGLLVLQPTHNLMVNKYIIVAAALAGLSCNNNTPDTPGGTTTPSSVTGTAAIPAPQNISYTITGVYPHDTSSFTQGLQWHNGKMYEGSGDFEHSGVQISELKSGKTINKHTMGTKDIFGEGITLLNGKLYQLTWQNHLIYIYDEKNLGKPEKTINWPNEGWGITNDGTNLIISDGQAAGNLYVVSPADFKIQRIIQVTTNTGPVDKLNELEYINGFVYANVWMTDNIVKIDPASGHVKGVMNFGGLLRQYAAKEILDPHYEAESDVLNGIAWDSATRKMYITGKRWPKLFELSLNE